MTEDSVLNWWRYESPVTTDFKNYNLGFRSGVNNGGYYPGKAPTSVLFPPGEFELWTFPEADTLRLTRSPLHPRFIRFFNPWENTAPRLRVSGTEFKMQTLENRWGWFETTLFEDLPKYDSWFIQALGSQTYGKSGDSDTDPIQSDSAISIGDTVWIPPPCPYP